MDLLIILTYVAIAYLIFKVFKIPLNKWTVPTAALGGVVLVGSLILLMNYNHPYTYQAQKSVITIPIIPQVSGNVISVTTKTNEVIHKGEVLFQLDPSQYQSKVARLQAELVTMQHDINVLDSQLDEAVATTQQYSAERDLLRSDYQRYVKGSRGSINPFTEQEITNARHRYLAQEAVVQGSNAKQEQIRHQIDSTINGENSQLVSLKAQLAEANYNLEQTTIKAPSEGYVTQVFAREGLYATAMPFRPVMVFIPIQEKRIVAEFRQNSMLRLKVGDEAEVVFNALPGKVFKAKVSEIIPVIPGGSYQSEGKLQNLNLSPEMDGLYVTLELAPEINAYQLPDGVTAQVAVYTDHFSHLSVMRKVLLRMTSWLHYLYLDH